MVDGPIAIAQDKLYSLSDAMPDPRRTIQWLRCALARSDESYGFDLPMTIQAGRSVLPITGKDLGAQRSAVTPPC